MRFGVSPQEISLLAAQAQVTADALYHQTGDPDSRLVLVQGADGMWSTQTVANQRLMQQGYSQNKTMMEYVLYGALALGGVYGLYYLFKR